MNSHPFHVGIDIGRVLMAPSTDDGEADTSFLQASDQDAMTVPPAAGAFAVVRELVELTGGSVWLVSKCGPRIQALTLAWLAHWRFHQVTGMPEEHVRFCRKRPEKADHARALGLGVFIDDRVDVLSHLVPLVPRLYLFGHQSRPAPDFCIPVSDWAAVRRQLVEKPGTRLAPAR